MAFGQATKLWKTGLGWPQVGQHKINMLILLKKQWWATGSTPAASTIFYLIISNSCKNALAQIQSPYRIFLLSKIGQKNNMKLDRFDGGRLILWQNPFPWLATFM